MLANAACAFKNILLTFLFLNVVGIVAPVIFVLAQLPSVRSQHVPASTLKCGGDRRSAFEPSRLFKLRGPFTLRGPIALNFDILGNRF